MYLDGLIPDLAPLAEPVLYPDGKTAEDPQHEVNSHAIYVYKDISPVSTQMD